MAVISMDFYSRELKTSTLITVVVPDSTRIENIPVSKRKCLYLLHGLSDDGSAFLRLSKVELYVQETGIVVIMPSAGRSMYCDGINGQNYFTHIAEEIPEYMELVFGISRKREDNYIAGISMGGMGAARIALTYPERFTAVGLFSGLLDLSMLVPFITDADRQEFPFLLGAELDMGTSPLNPINLLDANRHAPLKIIVRCGREDELYPMSIEFFERAEELGLDVTGIFGDGGHDWRTWEPCIDDFIKMMAGEQIG